MNRLTTFTAVLAVLSGVLFCGCSSPRVEWLGNPVVGRTLQPGNYHAQPSITSHAIGLREEGVVIWRRVEP
jgi:hypothetical protein